MLALLTQTKVQRPWMQFGTGTVIHFPLKNMEEEPQTLPELKPLAAVAAVAAVVEVVEVVEVCKRKKCSKIPRMIRSTCKPTNTKKEQKLSVEKQTVATDTCHIQAAATAPATSAGSVASVAVVAPVVRSTRTSRCRIKLAHPEWPPVNRSPSSSPVGHKREISEPQRVAASGKRKCNIEPLLQLSQSVIEIYDPLKNFGGRKQLLRLMCSDQKQINVPCQLINRYSSLMCDRQKEPNFCISRPIQLDAISSVTLMRLVQWMQQHFHEDPKQLQKASPSLQNAKRSSCSWDETFLGFDLESILQLLLAAHFLGINPLIEHTMLYFLELIKQRNHIENVSSQHESQTQTDSSEQNDTFQTKVELPQFVTTSHLC